MKKTFIFCNRHVHGKGVDQSPMKFNLPMMNRLWQRLRQGKAPEFRSLATHEEVLCPRETAINPPAIFPAGALERITNLSPWRTWQIERSLWEGGEAVHNPTLAYEVEDVYLVGSYLYKGSAKKNVGSKEEHLYIPSGVERQTIEHANLVSSWAGAQFFGTLLVDDFPLALISEGNPENISTSSECTPHEVGYRELLELPRAPQVYYAHINHLTLYEDSSQNSFKAKRYQILRDRLGQKMVGVRNTPTGVYIRRGKSMGEPRILENESEVEAFLAASGFNIVDPSTMAADQIARLAFGAKIVVGVEGSQLSHGVFAAAEGAAFLVLQPPWRFAMSYKEFIDCMGMRFAFIVGDTSPAGFTVRLPELQQMIEQLHLGT